MRRFLGELVFIGLLIVFAGTPYLNSARIAWTTHWLLEDGREGTAVVTRERFGGRAWRIGYAYTVEGHTFDAIWSVRSDDETEKRFFNARVGERLPVYFSESHPWLSSLDRRKRKDFYDALVLLAGLIVILLVVIGIRVWNWKERRRRRLGVGATARANSGTAGHHTKTSGWAMRLETVKSADDVPPEERETETISLSNATVYELPGADGRTRTYHSLDEMPPKLRAQIERSLAASSEPEPAGEIAPEIRQRFEAFASPRPGQSVTLHFRDDHGHEHTYHSLEELPPDVRALYDQLVHHHTQTKSRSRANR
jgi:hypothetical protein